MHLRFSSILFLLSLVFFSHIQISFLLTKPALLFLPHKSIHLTNKHTAIFQIFSNTRYFSHICILFHFQWQISLLRCACANVTPSTVRLLLIAVVSGICARQLGCAQAVDRLGGQSLAAARQTQSSFKLYFYTMNIYVCVCAWCTQLFDFVAGHNVLCRTQHLVTEKKRAFMLLHWMYVQKYM